MSLVCVCACERVGIACPSIEIGPMQCTRACGCRGSWAFGSLSQAKDTLTQTDPAWLKKSSQAAGHTFGDVKALSDWLPAQSMIVIADRSHASWLPMVS